MKIKYTQISQPHPYLDKLALVLIHEYTYRANQCIELKRYYFIRIINWLYQTALTGHVLVYHFSIELPPYLFKNSLGALISLKGNNQCFMWHVLLKHITPAVVTENTMRHHTHYFDVLMSEMASQMTGVSIAHSIICSDAHHRKHQGSASVAFGRGIHWWPVDSPHKGPNNTENVFIWWCHHALSQVTIDGVLVMIYWYVIFKCVDKGGGGGGGGGAGGAPG